MLTSGYCQERLRNEKGGNNSMPKTIKLEDHVYQRLDALRFKGMTFSETVDRLITIKEIAGTLASQVARTGDQGETMPSGSNKQ